MSLLTLPAKIIEIPTTQKVREPLKVTHPPSKVPFWPLCPPLPAKFEPPSTSGPKCRLGPMRPVIRENFVKIAPPVFEILRVEKNFSTARPSKRGGRTPNFFAHFNSWQGPLRCGQVLGKSLLGNSVILEPPIGGRCDAYVSMSGKTNSES